MSYWHKRSLAMAGIFLLLSLLLVQGAEAEDLSAWPYKIAVAIGNAPTDETHPTQGVTNGAATVSIDTAALISQGLMRSDCGDLRVADAGGTLLRFNVSGCNSSSTTVHFVVPQVPANGSMEAYIHHGNLSAASASEDPANFSPWFQPGTPVLTMDDFRSNWRKCESESACRNANPVAGTTGELVNVYNIVPNPFTSAAAKKMFYTKAGSYNFTLRRNSATYSQELRVYSVLTGAEIFSSAFQSGNNDTVTVTVTVPADGPTIWYYKAYTNNQPIYLEDVTNLPSIFQVNGSPLRATVLRPYTQYFPSFLANWKRTSSGCSWDNSACLADKVDPVTNNYIYDESLLVPADVNTNQSSSGWGYRKQFYLVAGTYEYCVYTYAATDFTTKIFDDTGNMLHTSTYTGDKTGCRTFIVPRDMTVLWTVRKVLSGWLAYHGEYTSFKRVGDPGPASLPQVSLFSCPSETYPGVSNACTVEASTIDNAPVHYKWTIEGGDPGMVTGPSTNVKFVSPGTKTVRAKMWRDDLGETYATYTSTVVNVLNPITGLTVTCPQSAYVNEEVVCTANLTASGGVTYNYSWQTGGGQITENNGSSIKVKFMDAGAKSVTVDVHQTNYPSVSKSASAEMNVSVGLTLGAIYCAKYRDRSGPVPVGEVTQCSVSASTTIGTLVYEWSAAGSGAYIGSPSSATTDISFTQPGLKSIQVRASLLEYPEAAKTAYLTVDISPAHIILDSVTCPASVGKLQPFTCDFDAFLQEYLIRLDLWNWGTARYDFSWSTSPGGVVREKTTGSAVTASRDIPGEGIVEGKEQHGQATMVFGEAGPQTVTLRAYVMQTPAIYVERTINVTVVMPPPTVNSVSCQEATLGQKVHCSINAQAVDGTLRYLWVAQEGTVGDNTSPDTDIVFRTPGTKTLTAIAYLEEDPAMAVNTSVTVNVTDNPMEVQISCPESVTTGDTFNCTAQASAAWGTPVFTWSMDGGTVNSVGPAGYFTPKKAGTLPVRVTMSLAGADWLTKTATTSVKVIGENDITAQIVGPKGVYVRTENTYEAQAPCITEGRCTVRWRVDGVEQEGPFLTVTFPVEGRYVLQVEIMYTGSTLSKVSELAVQVGELPKPIVNIKGPGAVFVGEPTLYKVEVAEKHRNLNVTGRWILFDGSYAEGETVTVIATAGGYQMLAYEAWIEGEKEATVRITKKRINCVAYVFPVPKISVKSVEGAAPYRVTFKTQDTVKRVPGADYAITYKWDFGDGETQTTTNTIVGHTFTKIGAYQVRMTAMDQHGNTSTDTKTITAGTPPVEIALKVSASNKAVRAPVEIYVKSAITKRSTLDRLESHTWAIDGVVVQDTQPGWVKTTFREPGTHTVTYAATMKSGAVGTGDTTIVVSPNQPPACDIEYKDNPTSRYVYLKAKCSDPDGRMSGYKWDLDDGRGFRNGNMNISFKATETRTYNVTVKGIDDANEACTFTKAIPITR